MGFQKLFLISIIIAVFAFEIISANRQSYGQLCNETLKCNSGAWLKCDNETCICAKPDEMAYDVERESCTVKVGERCKFTISGDNYETTNCVKGASCNISSGICMCDEGFYEGPGDCIKVKSRLQACTKKEESDVKQFLTCVNNTCDCNPETSIFNQYRCVGKLGKPCLDGHCDNDAQCDVYSSTCICPDSSDQASMDSDGIMKCRKSYGNTCSATNPCMSELVCLETTCNCPTPKVYSGDVTKPCVSMSNGPCQTDSDCSAQAACVTKMIYARCECKNGFVEGHNGKCYIDYENPCNGSGSWETEICAPWLKCVNQQCKCDNSLTLYDKKSKSCKILAGASCPWISYASELTLKDIQRHVCVDNASCKYVYENVAGVCTCKDGYPETVVRTCDAMDNFILWAT